LAALDIGSHINAGAQLLPEAGAQRTLEAVSCKALLGHVVLMAALREAPQDDTSA